MASGQWNPWLASGWKRGYDSMMVLVYKVAEAG